MFGFLRDFPAALQRRPHPCDGRVRVSDRFANVVVTNQFGARFHFHRDFVGGRMLVISTMYTQCRGSCPQTNHKLELLREELSPVFGEDLVFLSISLEPEVDQPSRLFDYSKQYGADTSSTTLCPWYFLTGRKHDLETLRQSLGLYDLNPKFESDIKRHDATLLFGNCDRDRWALLPAQLRIPLLLESIRRICGTTPQQRFGFEL